jgi:hypothetical protein
MLSVGIWGRLFAGPFYFTNQVARQAVCSMSALGHKRTWRLQFAMSALHSIADIRVM